MKNCSIIIADDHTLFRSGIVSLLKDLPQINKIFEAKNGLEVMALLDKNRIELVLLDLKMPDMNGLEACRAIKKKFPETKVVILTMIDQEQVIIRMLQEDINAYLLKNCTENILKEAIYEVIEKGFYFDDYTIKLMHKSVLGKKDNLTSNLNLSKRESEVLEILCQGKNTYEIAETLFISPRTVEAHKQSLMEKTGTHNSVELAIFSIKNGLIEMNNFLYP